MLGVITVTLYTGSSSPGRLISTAILCLRCTASPLLCLALWSANSLTNPLLHSLIHNAFSVTHTGFNVALGANVAECRKVRTITAYLRWRPVLKLRKEKKVRWWQRKGGLARVLGKRERGLSEAQIHCWAEVVCLWLGPQGIAHRAMVLRPSITHAHTHT